MGRNVGVWMAMGVMVVLCFCAAACGYPVDLAGSTHYLNPWDTMTLLVVGSTPEGYEVYLQLQQSHADAFRQLGLVQVLPPAGADALAKDLGEEGQPGWWYFRAASEDPMRPVVVGAAHFALDFYSADAYGWAEFLLYDGDGELVSTWMVMTPEPTSMVGFGLAGVFLSRKRRASAQHVMC